MRTLVIEALFDNKSEKVEVPYILGSRVDLPNIYPFNKNIYLGPDDGFSLNDMYIKENGDLDYCQTIIKLENNPTRFSPFKHDLIVFIFTLR